MRDIKRMGVSRWLLLASAILAPGSIALLLLTNADATSEAAKAATRSDLDETPLASDPASNNVPIEQYVPNQIAAIGHKRQISAVPDLFRIIETAVNLDKMNAAERIRVLTNKNQALTALGMISTVDAVQRLGSYLLAPPALKTYGVVVADYEVLPHIYSNDPSRLLARFENAAIRGLAFADLPEAADIVAEYRARLPTGDPGKGDVVARSQQYTGLALMSYADIQATRDRIGHDLFYKNLGTEWLRHQIRLESDPTGDRVASH